MTIRSTARRRSTASAVLAATVLLAGCGNTTVSTGTSSSKGGDTATSSSPSAASTAPSTTSTAGGLTAQTLFPAAYGAATKAGSVHLVMSSSGGQHFKATGDVTYAGGSPTMRMTMDGLQGAGGGAMEIRLVEKMLYLQVPGLTPAGKFVAIDPADESSPMGKSFGQLSGQLDPLKSLQAVKDAVRSVKLVGHDTVEGTRTDRYHVVVDTEKALSKLGSSLPSSVSAQVPSTMDYDLWLDQRHLMRQLELTVSGMTIHMELSKWGEPVAVARPAAAQLVRMPQQ